ncbi:GNAT family N-acetyltransferase [Clostridium magnum]|uniref:Ribosomal-protein-alanine N-acetyltransferase n=1 Tax=Clostridium magnum DSM 2767 TaxID=1121326 RepID=A0A162SEG8_9CLOT|nr:GNAT family N-acetyltransferase [Clostridium magnum]KZL91137.1 ribosomal-protein-alanine N-acetyltransferase [Clostridium magnum DSM 2767]SHI17998.1 Acetyltransferase (GNAT) family protein [Clostridium magnum DSM 2767]
MYKCVGLNMRNLDQFRKLNKAKNDFNTLNRDFFEVYDSCNFAQQIFLRHRVKLLKNDSRYIGYIWTELDDINVYTINALNILNTEKNSNKYLLFKYLLDTLKKNCNINYNCEKNSYNFDILKHMGFIQKEGTFVLHLSIEENMPLLIMENLEFEILKKGRDEQKRCELQNDIFKNEDRIPLSIEDIYLDEVQTYYFDKGSVFIKKDGNYIGYGQVIIEDSVPVIVNFGILKESRGKGYSKALLVYLIKIIKYNGFSDVMIKVKTSNKIALNLYESTGFKIINEIYNWKLKT